MNAFLTPEEEAPLKLCSKCKTTHCIPTGKPCKEVEDLLPKPRSGGHRKEFSCDPQTIEALATKTAFKIKYGKSYFKGRRGEDNRG